MATQATYNSGFEANLGASTDGGAARNWARSLGWFSIGLGMTELLMPRRLGRLIGVRDHHGLLRAMGAREIGAGIAVLTERIPTRSIGARVTGDAVDLALLAGGLLSSGAKRGRVAGALAAVGGVTALDVLCMKQLAENEPSAISETIQTVAVNRSPEECYRFWRDLENLPRFMKHLESVTVTGEGRSHWVAKGPAGMRVEWDAEMTEDPPNRISWRSLEGGDVDNAGSVRFIKAPTGHGTFVKAHIRYRPPAGKIGATVAKLFGEEPSIQAKMDLRRFKQMIETGEIATTEGQTSGRESPSERIQQVPAATRAAHA